MHVSIKAESTQKSELAIYLKSPEKCMAPNVRLAVANEKLDIFL